MSRIVILEGAEENEDVKQSNIVLKGGIINVVMIVTFLYFVFKK